MVSSDFSACKDKKVATDLSVMSSDSSPSLGGVLPSWCWLLKLCMAAEAYAAVLGALAADAAARPFDLLLTYLENGHVEAYSAAF